MKFLFVLFTLVMVTACGGRHHPSANENVITENPIKPAVCDVAHESDFAPVVKIDRTLMETLSHNPDGKPFSRDNFWLRLERDTRIRLNLALNKKIRDLPENMIYKAIPLFVENYIKNPGQSFYIRAGKQRVIFYTEVDSLKAPGGDCDDHEAAIARVDLTKIFRHSQFERKLDCYGPKMHVEVTLYKDAAIFTKYFDTYAFVGTELIRTNVNGSIRLKGLTEDETNLEASISSGSVLNIKLNGTSGSINGTGTCN